MTDYRKYVSTEHGCEYVPQHTELQHCITAGPGSTNAADPGNLGGDWEYANCISHPPDNSENTLQAKTFVLPYKTFSSNIKTTWG